MTTPLEQVTALPVSGNVNKAGLRDMLTRRTPLTLAASEDLADFAVADPATGVVPLYVIQNGTLYEYDSLDTTTVASAVCLVSGDTVGLRYKTGGITAPWSVLTVGTTAQPVSPAPSVGDTYLVPTAATGTDWVGKDGQVAIYSRAGWQFASVPVGRGLYAEDTNIRWFRKADGSWMSGFGAVSIGADGINITNMLGAKASFAVKVENQTTNTPPASPVAFVAYIVGSAPAGGWSAYSPGDVAMCLSDGVWTRVIPANGDQVYDKTLDINVQWKGTAWVSASGNLIGFNKVQTPGTGSVTINSGANVYAFSPTSLPVITQRNSADEVSLTYKAKSTSSLLRFKYSAYVVITTITVGNETTNSRALSLALCRGTETDAIACKPFQGAKNIVTGDPIADAFPVDVEFDISPGSTDEKFYRLLFMSGATNNGSTDILYYVASMQNRIFTVEELLP